jgi:hypothetical protein
MDLKQFANEVHRPVVRKFPMRKVVVDGINDVWAVDLVDMQEWAEQNDGYRYMLNIVDVFSRYAWSLKLKTKTGKEVRHAFDSIDVKPRKIWSDDGKEFINRDMNEYYRKNKITRFGTYSESKASIVERFNRTLKTWLFKKFTEKQSRRWVDMLDELLDRYNNSKHSALGMSPTKATDKKNEEKLFEKQFGKYLESEPPVSSLAVGDHVRISRVKGKFEKGYLPNYSTEIFQIVEKKYTNPPTFILQDYKRRRITGAFYEQELLKTEMTDTFLIEKVIRRRKGKALVKWLGYSEDANSWIDEKDLENFKGGI